MSDRPDELRRQFATVWRVARTGIDSMREVVVRSGREGKLRLDIALLQRERAQRLEDLGSRLCAWLDESGGDEPLPEELRAAAAEVREIESRIQADIVRATDNAFGAPRGYEPEAASDYGDDAPDAPATDEEESSNHRPARAATANRTVKRNSNAPRGTSRKKGART